MPTAGDMPTGPKAEPRKRRGIWSTENGPAPDGGAAMTADAPVTPTAKAPKRPAKKKGWDRSGQVSVVLGSERHARLKSVWASNAHEYEHVADLIRDAIDDKLDRLDNKRKSR